MRPPDLIDRQTLPLRRARAREEALFLHHDTADEIEERLAEVNRRFTAPAVVTAFPQLWACAPRLEVARAAAPHWIR